MGGDTYFVMAGEVYVGSVPRFLKTTLGSCVAMVCWHPELKLGAMCHYLLSRQAGEFLTKPENFYGNFALQNMKALLLKKAPLREFEFSLYGGGSLLHKEYDNKGVAKKNIDLAQTWLDNNNIEVKLSSVGGSDCRSICLDLSDGSISLKSYAQLASSPSISMAASGKC